MALHAVAGLAATTKSIPSPLAPPPGVPAGLRALPDRFALRSAFFSPSLQPLLPSSRPDHGRFSMRSVAAKQAYICRDCGYIYNERIPFEKLPDEYFCPVCGARKRRFRAYQPAVTKNANNGDVRKARKAQMKKDEAIGQALPIGIVVGVAALAGLYLYLNSVY